MRRLPAVSRGQLAVSRSGQSQGSAARVSRHGSGVCPLPLVYVLDPICFVSFEGVMSFSITSPGNGFLTK